MLDANKTNLLNNFLNAISDTQMDLIFEEIGEGINLVFSHIVYFDKVRKTLSLQSEIQSQEEILEQLLSQKYSDMKVYKKLFNYFESTEGIVDFACQCLKSEWFNPNLPFFLISFLEKNGISESEFCFLMIISIKDDFIDYFINDINLEMWTLDMLKILIENND
ncbi:hypothetical protein SSABA_v1c02830 [Spiroplasma sabaudiense Ar-1343]|uniref:Uncharacterized protein n=1 Tax=Spiroplasma sabaudiense Ar-1343 TaxID=1276257 RepID=W6AA41_9MOLU|nr:hypothetical protein [Spiroplasma sabaudiense]AHI53695.1 hypothetical protein SSABA_v1c02830 [Spiroplasma sabaudiense Ar-1343]